MTNENYKSARDALTKAAEAAERIDDAVRRAETLTNIGHGFIRLGTEPFRPGQKSPSDDGAGFQPHETSR